VNRRRFLIAAAAAPWVLRDARPVAARPLGGTPLALVTADLESRIVAVDLTTGRIHARLATLPDPRSIESVLGTVAVVAHTDRGALSIVDGPSLRVRRVLHGFSEPRYTAGSPDGVHAYVTDSGSGEVVAVGLPRGQVVGRVDVDGPARHIAVAPSGRMLWVALGTKAARLAIVDVTSPARPRVVRTVRAPFLAHDVGFEPDGRRVWVTSGDRKEVAVFDARSARLVRRLASGSPPQHVTFLAGRAHVTSGDDGTLDVHRLADGRIVRTVRIPLGSYNVQQGWGVLLTPSLSRGTLCVLDAQGRVRNALRAAASSHDACFVFSA
jgi:DNA-binding beta-propeller fold protein YncE